MITPKIFSENLKKNIITTSMLEAALFSVNKRAKNYRDAERKYRHTYGIYSYKNTETMKTKKEGMYKKKEKLLSVVEPICIHKEFSGYEKIRVYDYESEYEKKYFYHLLHGTIIWENSYMDWGLDEEISFFDYIVPERPTYRYYLYYIVGTHTFHSPIKNPQDYNLPIKEIDELDTFGMESKELVSMQFVDKVIDLINQSTYKYVQDIETVLPEYPEYNRDDLSLLKPEWSEIWNCILPDLRIEIKKLHGNIRPLTKDEKDKISIWQKCKNPNKKMKKQGISDVVWKAPKVRYPSIKLKCPEMSLELSSFIKDNYKDEMTKKEFSLMILQSPFLTQFQESLDLYCSMKVYCKQLQKKADELFAKTHGQILISDLLE